MQYATANPRCVHQQGSKAVIAVVGELIQLENFDHYKNDVRALSDFFVELAIPECQTFIYEMRALLLVHAERRMHEERHLLDDSSLDRRAYVHPFPEEDQRELIQPQESYHHARQNYIKVGKCDYLAIRLNPEDLQNPPYFICGLYQMI